MQKGFVDIGVLLSASLSLARQASSIIRRVSQGELIITQKGSDGVDDPMTQADEASQKLIIAGLWSVYPGLSIVGEEDTPELQPALEQPALDLIDLARVPEGLRNVPMDDVCVYVDPLDATKEFTLGRTWCVMTLIGITLRGVPVAGVMHQPFEGDNEDGHCIYSLQGYGVHGLKKKEKLGTGVVAVTTASHSSAALDEVIALVAPDSVVREGGCGYKALMVAQGQADVYLYPQPGTKRWDTAAPEAIFREMGGVMTDRFGKDIIYEKQGDMLNQSLVACLDPVLHKNIIGKINNSKI